MDFSVKDFLGPSGSPQELMKIYEYVRSIRTLRLVHRRFCRTHLWTTNCFFFVGIETNNNFRMTGTLKATGFEIARRTEATRARRAKAFYRRISRRPFSRHLFIRCTGATDGQRRSSAFPGRRRSDLTRVRFNVLTKRKKKSRTRLRDLVRFLRDSGLSPRAQVENAGTTCCFCRPNAYGEEGKTHTWKFITFENRLQWNGNINFNNISLLIKSINKVFDEKKKITDRPNRRVVLRGFLFSPRVPKHSAREIKKSFNRSRKKMNRRLNANILL